MDFIDLPEKLEFSGNEVNTMIVLKPMNGRNISYKTYVSIFERFYINSKILIDLKNSLDGFRKDVDKIISNIVDKDYVDAKYLLKKDSIYEKSKILTEDRLKALLGEYSNVDQIEIDIQNCMEHSRSVATSLANSLASTAVVAKSTNAQMENDTINTSNVIDAMGQPESEES